MGIEPTSEAWEASILPLYDARSIVIILTMMAGCPQLLLFGLLQGLPVDRAGVGVLLTISMAALRALARARMAAAHTTAR